MIKQKKMEDKKLQEAAEVFRDLETHPDDISRMVLMYQFKELKITKIYWMN